MQCDGDKMNDITARFLSTFSQLFLSLIFVQCPLLSYVTLSMLFHNDDNNNFAIAL